MAPRLQCRCPRPRSFRGHQARQKPRIPGNRNPSHGPSRTHSERLPRLPLRRTHPGRPPQAPFRLITTHLPYTGLNWLSRDPAIKQKAIHTIDTALKGSAYCGARLAVLHPQTLTNEPFPPRQNEYIDLIRRWADRAHKLGLRLAIETGFPPSVDAFVSPVQTIDHPQVGATIDVGHQGRFVELVARVPAEDRAKPASITAYKDTTLAIISRLGPKVFHLHVHDIDPASWVEHKPFQHGFVDYPRLFAQLRVIRYSGVLVFEIGGDPVKCLPIFAMPAFSSSVG